MARQVNLSRGFLVDFSCKRECTPSVVHIITSDRYIYLVYFQPPDATNDSSHRRAESTTVHQDSRRRFLNPSAPVPHVKMTKCARLTRSACAQTTAVNSAQTQVSQNTEFCKPVKIHSIARQPRIAYAFCFCHPGCAWIPEEIRHTRCGINSFQTSQLCLISAIN